MRRPCPVSDLAHYVTGLGPRARSWFAIRINTRPSLRTRDRVAAWVDTRPRLLHPPARVQPRAVAGPHHPLPAPDQPPPPPLRSFTLPRCQSRHSNHQTQHQQHAPHPLPHKHSAPPRSSSTLRKPPRPRSPRTDFAQIFFPTRPTPHQGSDNTHNPLKRGRRHRSPRDAQKRIGGSPKRLPRCPGPSLTLAKRRETRRE